ncbi:MAG: DNA polymerase I [Leptospirillia bacterium]
MARPSLYLIDGYAQIYRAFFAIRGFTTSAGLPSNAIYGFATMMNKLLTEHRPDAAIVCLDAKGPNFRHERYPAYKSTRQKMPDDLNVQLPYIRRLVDAMNLVSVELPGFEADDLIGTLAHRGESGGYDVTIVTGDKDMMQLVGDHVRIYDSMKDRFIGPPEVVEKFSVEPARVVDIMGLMGDSSDNVPGIPGVGEVTARKLIAQFHDLESVLAGAGEIKANGVRAKVMEHGELARLSRELVTIRTDVPFELNLKDAATRTPDFTALGELYRELEFRTLLTNLQTAKTAPGEAAHTPETAARKHYATVTDHRVLAHLIARIRTVGEVSVDLETTSLDPLRADIVGVALSLAADEGYYIPVGHVAGSSASEEEIAAVAAQLPRDEVLAALAPVMEDAAIAKIGQNIKYDLNVFERAGTTLSGITFDTMIADYLISPNRRSHGLDGLALAHLNHQTISYEEVAGKGARQIPFAEVAVSTATPYAAEDAEITLALKQSLDPLLDEAGVRSVFEDMEMPLLPVLARMERNGFLLDLPYLSDMSKEMAAHIDSYTREIHGLAGEEFNIASPKQLQVILFEKLGFKPGKKTKTGYSTDEEVLAKLAQDHPLPEKILALRQYTKLKSTYVDALPALVNPDTGRVHTSLNQTVAATGRLSSSDPNLQNIPIRTEDGKKIRRAFICPKGSRLLSADYSQIELRILAHVAQDAALIEAFHSGADIHSRTAAEVFGVMEGLVTEPMRRAAKAINFGIIYGMGAFSLAQDLGVSQQEAKQTIERYFATYSGVREWIGKTQEEAAQTGYVTTIYGRRRQIPELAMQNAQQRAYGGRTATNTVIQGTAADIIKRAMIHIDQRLTEAHPDARMLLQIHDELIFEAKEKALAPLEAMVREEMESAVKLAVPLVVDIGTGNNWEEAH